MQRAKEDQYTFHQPPQCKRQQWATTLEAVKDLRTELRIRDAEMKALFEAMLKGLTAVCATCSASPPPTSPPTSPSNPRATLYFTRLQIIETQVPTVEQRVRNVEKVRRDEKTGQVTHRRADALDNSFGQLDKRVVILMRGLDSSFRNELEKMKDNEASIAHRKNKKLTAMTCLEQRLKSFTMDQVTLRADLLQQTAIFCEGKDSLVQLQQCLGKIEGRMQQQAEAMEAMVIGQESLEKTMESFVDGMSQQVEDIAKQARESKAILFDNFGALDSKMGELANAQEQQAKLYTAHTLEQEIRQECSQHIEEEYQKELTVFAQRSEDKNMTGISNAHSNNGATTGCKVTEVNCAEIDKKDTQWHAQPAEISAENTDWKREALHNRRVPSVQRNLTRETRRHALLRLDTETSSVATAADGTTVDSAGSREVDDTHESVSVPVAKRMLERTTIEL